MLKHLSILALAVALVIGLTAQVFPRTEATMTEPCKGMTPACLDYTGCTAVASAPPSPAYPPVAVRWVDIVYAASTAAMVGRSLEPELFPPILTA